jgi:dolichyldiphosphatase
MEDNAVLGLIRVGECSSLFTVPSCLCLSSSTEIKTILSRFHLQYHTPHQILWGLGIGVALGISLYVVAELIPSRRPNSFFAHTRSFLVENKVSTWLQIRDGWAIWADGGREDEWMRWREKWDKKRIRALVQAKKSQ